MISLRDGDEEFRDHNESELGPPGNLSFHSCNNNQHECHRRHDTAYNVGT